MEPRQVKRVVVVACVLGVIVLTGCTAASSTPEQTASSTGNTADQPSAASSGAAEQRAVGTILLAAPERPTLVMEAIVAGTLTRLEGGCLALTIPGEEPNVVQFPFGSELSRDGMSVVVPDYGTARVGDEIIGGGGFTNALAAAPEECRIGGEFAVWQTP